MYEYIYCTYMSVNCIVQPHTYIHSYTKCPKCCACAIENVRGACRRFASHRGSRVGQRFAHEMWKFESKTSIIGETDHHGNDECVRVVVGGCADGDDDQCATL